MPTTKDFKLEELSKYFHLPEKAVAKVREYMACALRVVPACAIYASGHTQGQCRRPATCIITGSRVWAHDS